MTNHGYTEQNYENFKVLLLITQDGRRLDWKLFSLEQEIWQLTDNQCHEVKSS